MSFTTLQDSAAHSGAYSMSPSKSGGADPMAYRGHSATSPVNTVRLPIEVPSPGRFPVGGRPAASHSANVLLRRVRCGARGHQTSYSSLYTVSLALLSTMRCL